MGWDVSVPTHAHLYTSISTTTLYPSGARVGWDVNVLKNARIYLNFNRHTLAKWGWGWGGVGRGGMSSKNESAKKILTKQETNQEDSKLPKRNVRPL